MQSYVSRFVCMKLSHAMQNLPVHVLLINTLLPHRTSEEFQLQEVAAVCTCKHSGESGAAQP